MSGEDEINKSVKTTTKVKSELESFKIHKRQPLNEVIKNLIDFYKKFGKIHPEWKMSGT